MTTPVPNPVSRQGSHPAKFLRTMQKYLMPGNTGSIQLLRAGVHASSQTQKQGGGGIHQDEKFNGTELQEGFEMEKQSYTQEVRPLQAALPDKQTPEVLAC